MSYRNWTQRAVLPVVSSVMASFLLASFASIGAVAAQGAPEKAVPEEEVLEPEASQQEAKDVQGNHLHVHSSFALRAIPIGTQLGVDGGYRMMLFDSESVLLKDTYLEAGVTTTTSPSNFWGGAYIEALPVAVLKLRASAQSLNYFGTLGNNAPFIGLFGTVIGIIISFEALGNNPKGGLEVVGPGIAEALVATAVGLLVAIPAVVVFNLCKARVKKSISNASYLGSIILAWAERGDG